MYVCTYIYIYISIYIEYAKSPSPGNGDPRTLGVGFRVFGLSCSGLRV